MQREYFYQNIYKNNSIYQHNKYFSNVFDNRFFNLIDIYISGDS